MVGLLAWPATVQSRQLSTWCETSTPDFQMLSDLPADEQAALLAMLQRFGRLAEPYLPGQRLPNPPALRIIVFSNRRDFQKLTGKQKFAGFMQPSLETNRLLIGPLQRSLNETTQHEYAHYLLRNRLDVSLPMWFDEGLASLLGATRWPDGKAVIGRLPLDRMRDRVRYNVAGETPLRSLSRSLAATSIESWSQARIDAFYDWTWLVTHYLYFGDLYVGDGNTPESRERLNEYLAAGDRPITDFLGISASGLLRTLQQHLDRLPPPLQVDALPVGTSDAEFSCLSEFQRDHELAGAILSQNPENARKLLRPHVESQGDNADLLVTLARIELAAGDPAAAGQLAARAAALAPASAAALILNADLAVQDCLFDTAAPCRERWSQATTLYRSALKADPERFDAVLGLGLGYLYTGRPGEAVNYLRVAYAKAPWAAVTNYYLGESYRLVGDTRAAGYLRNARNWADLPVWRLLAQASLELLSESAARPADSESG